MGLAFAEMMKIQSRVGCKKDHSTNSQLFQKQLDKVNLHGLKIFLQSPGIVSET